MSAAFWAGFSAGWFGAYALAVAFRAVRRGRLPYRHAVILAALAALAVLAATGLSSGLLTVHGWDWSAGTGTSYCGAYLPHGDVYCEHAR